MRRWLRHAWWWLTGRCLHCGGPMMWGYEGLVSISYVGRCAACGYEEVDPA